LPVAAKHCLGLRFDEFFGQLAWGVGHQCCTHSKNWSTTNPSWWNWLQHQDDRGSNTNHEFDATAISFMVFRGWEDWLDVF
jgi:hypothetical protein